jgi:hypothetical protein
VNSNALTKARVEQWSLGCAQQSFVGVREGQKVDGRE